MHHSDYEMRLLAQQRSAELIAEAARLNRIHELRGRHRRRLFRSILARLRRPGRGRTVVDLRDPPPAEPAPYPTEAFDATGGATPAVPTDLPS